MADQKNSIEMARRLKKVYVIALSILVIMLLLSQAIIQFTIKFNENDSRVVNIAGRQRMLSQSINKAAFGLYNSTDKKDHIRYFNELDTSLGLWKQSHKGLQNGDEGLGLPGKNSPWIEGMFEAIEPQYEAIVNAATEIKMITSNLDYNHETLISAIQIIKNNESDFLKGMDAIVFQYDLESKQKIAQIKVIEIVILILSFFILGLEVLFIFRPALRYVKCAMEELSKIAIQDELTGLYNRHYFDTIIDVEMDRSDRYNEPLSMMLLDLDHFKNVNDTWGHPVGDELLKLTSRTMEKTKRNSDILIRFGGEEFIVLMPHTSIEGAAAAAEKIRAEIERNSHPVTGVQTVSIGVVERMKSESFRLWYKRTDDALYRAKESGRNRVVVADENENMLMATERL